jgi:hypothetical protein
MGNVFRTYNPAAPKKGVTKQQKPNVGPFPWIPNRNINVPRQPHERGNFFAQKATGTTADKMQQPSVIKLFPNNPVAVGVAAVQLMLDNPNRTELAVSNVGTTHIYLGFGRVPTALNYDFVLSPSGSANDGSGGVWISDIFTGAVWAISDVAAGSVALKELP